MALPGTDAFTDTNGTSLTAHSANWTANNGNAQINTNELAPNLAGDDLLVRWSADTFNNDQYAQAVASLLAFLSTAYIGLAVRASTSGANTTYGVEWAYGDQWYLYKTVAGTDTNLASGSPSAWSQGDTIRLEAEGTTVRVKRNSTQFTTQTDSAIASGAAGVVGNGTATNVSRLDSWEGGNLGGGGGPVIPVFMAQYRQRVN